MQIVLLTIILVSIAFIALGVNIFFRKDGKFPETEVGHNRHMRELGIKCAKCDEYGRWKRMMANKKAIPNPKKLKIDLEGLQTIK